MLIHLSFLIRASFFPEAATSVPKKRKNMKEFNKKEAIGDLLDAFTEVSISLHEL